MITVEQVNSRDKGEEHSYRFQAWQVERLFLLSLEFKRKKA